MIFERKRLVLIMFILGLISFSCSEKAPDVQDIVNRGKNQMDQYEFERAIESFEKAISRNPNDASLYCYLGKSHIGYLRKNAAIYINTDKTQKNAILKKAEQAYQKSLELDANNTCSHEGLGEYYRLIDDYQNSLLQYQAVAKLNPDNKKVYQEIGKIYIELDKPILAKEAFSILLENSEQSTDYDAEYKFISKDKVRVSDSEILLVCDVKWRIIDPIMYEGTVGYFEGAEMRMKDMFSAALLNVGSLANVGSYFLSPEAKQEIFRLVNGYSLKHFGIKLTEIKINLSE